MQTRRLLDRRAETRTQRGLLLETQLCASLLDDMGTALKLSVRQSPLLKTVPPCAGTEARERTGGSEHKAGSTGSTQIRSLTVSPEYRSSGLVTAV